MDILNGPHHTTVLIPGGTFIIHKSLIDTYESLYEAKIVEWQSKGYSDDDQTLIPQLYYDNPHLFKLIRNRDYRRFWDYLQ